MFSILAQDRRWGWQNFEKKTVSANASPGFFFKILPPSSPILGQNWKHDLARSCFILRSALQTKSAWRPHSKEPTFSQACIIAPPSVGFCGILKSIIFYYTYNICKTFAYILGEPSKTTQRTFSVKGGWGSGVPPFPLSFFEHNDCITRFLHVWG